MPLELDKLGWFYRGKGEQATGTPESLNHTIVYFLLATFTVTGFFTISLYIFHFSRLILSLFILPGKSVRLDVVFLGHTNADILSSSAHSAGPRRHGLW